MMAFGQRAQHMHTVAPWAAPELALWTGVVVQQLTDAQSEHHSVAAAVLRHQARSWLSGCQGLRRVLALLDVEPTWWLKRCLPALQQRWAEVDAALAERAAAKKAADRHARLLQIARDSQRRARARRTPAEHAAWLAERRRRHAERVARMDQEEIERRRVVGRIASRRHDAKLRAADEAAFLAENARKAQARRDRLKEAARAAFPRAA